jgi:thiamine-monophosphate kinase
MSVTAFGEVPEGRAVRRTTAQPGDVLCVTGTIGDAVLGLALLQARAGPWAEALSDAERAFVIDRYRHPRPRLTAAAPVLAHASAAMDVSDGLAGDLAKMMRASGTTAEIDLDAVPLSQPAQAAVAADREVIEALVTGGDDYEILCTVPPRALEPYVDACAAGGVSAAVIGTVREGGGLPLFRSGTTERRFERGSFSHF